MRPEERNSLYKLMDLLGKTTLTSEEIKGICFCISAYDRKKTLENLEKMIIFLKENPQSTYEEIYNHISIILGIGIVEDKE